MVKVGHWLEHHDVAAFFVPIDLQGASGGHMYAERRYESTYAENTSN